jgi:hypothetical protein
MGDGASASVKAERARRDDDSIAIIARDRRIRGVPLKCLRDARRPADERKNATQKGK